MEKVAVVETEVGDLKEQDVGFEGESRLAKQHHYLETMLIKALNVLDSIEKESNEDVRMASRNAIESIQNAIGELKSKIPTFTSNQSCNDQQHKPKTAMEKIQAVQTKVNDLRKEVNNFQGMSRLDKQYVYLDEMLTSELIQLDVIETKGKENVRMARKNAIEEVQNTIALLESKVPSCTSDQAYKHQQCKPKTAMEKIQEVKTKVNDLWKQVDEFQGKSCLEQQYIYLDNMLNSELIKLDVIETEGKEDIRMARKNATESIKNTLVLLESKVPTFASNQAYTNHQYKPKAAMERILEVQTKVDDLRKQVNEFQGKSCLEQQYIDLDKMRNSELIKLDVIETEGKEDIRMARKIAIESIKNTVVLLESKLPSSSSNQTCKHQQYKPKTAIEKIRKVQTRVNDLKKHVNEFQGKSRLDQQYVDLEEKLTSELIELDSIETEGKEDVRMTRKNAIRSIQNAFNELKSKVLTFTSNQSCGDQQHNPKTVMEKIQQVQSKVDDLRKQVSEFQGKSRLDKKYIDLENMLTRELIELDSIEIEGKEDVRVARRIAIMSIKNASFLLKLKVPGCTSNQSSEHQQDKSKIAVEKIQEVQSNVNDLRRQVNEFRGKSRLDKQYLYLEEMLTSGLIELDSVETEGKEDVRMARKNAVQSIQNTIVLLESKTPISASNQADKHQQHKPKSVMEKFQEVQTKINDLMKQVNEFLR